MHTGRHKDAEPLYETARIYKDMLIGWCTTTDTGPSLIRYSLSQQSSLLEIGGGRSLFENCVSDPDGARGCWWPRHGARSLTGKCSLKWPLTRIDSRHFL